MAVPAANWPITIFGQDLNRALPQAIQGIGGVSVLVPSLNKLPFAIITLSGTERIVTVGNVTNILDTEQLIILNKTIAAPTTVNLPLIATRQGIPVIIVDYGGNAGDITINPEGSNTIMGLVSATLTSNGQGVGSGAVIFLQPVLALNGWVQV